MAEHPRLNDLVGLPYARRNNADGVLDADALDWNITKSTHFIVYYKAAPEDFIRQLIDKSEDYYNKIAQDLGFTRYDFWTWDKRAKIYIYDNAADYRAATAQPAWSIGCAQVAQKIIQTFPYAKGFFETVLPHEISHIIFREFIGLGNSAIPLWLEEGVASYQEKIRYKHANMHINEAINEGCFIKLREVSSVNRQLMTNTQSPGLC